MKPLTLTFDFKKRRSDEVVISASGTIAFSETKPVVAIFGSSGAGKSTLLRWLAGLESADTGRLKVTSAGTTEIWEDEEQSLSPQARRIGYVAQGYALFPHLNVRENIGYGLRALSVSARNERIEELLSMFEIQGLTAQFPSTLSGGQKQRVAFARALSTRPELLLLDEPFAALDYPTRERLIPQLRNWLARFRTPALLVTHDPREASALDAPMLSFKEHHLSTDVEGL